LKYTEKIDQNSFSNKTEKTTKNEHIQGKIFEKNCNILLSEVFEWDFSQELSKEYVVKELVFVEVNSQSKIFSSNI